MKFNIMLNFAIMNFSSAQIWGNLISSTVFAEDKTNETSDAVCGANFCPSAGNDSSNFEQPSDKVQRVSDIRLSKMISYIDTSRSPI